MSARTMVLGLCMAATACGGGLYSFDSGGGSSNNVKVEGTFAGITLNDPDRNIVVFIYTDLCETEKANPDVCDDLLLPEDLPDLKSGDYKHMVKHVVKADALGEFFRVKKNRKGNLTIAYLQDNANNSDKKIEASDITITRDAMNNIIPSADNAVAMQANDGRLTDVQGKATADLDNVTVDFPGAAATSSDPTSTTSSSLGPFSTTTTSTSTVPVSTTISATQ